MRPTHCPRRDWSNCMLLNYNLIEYDYVINVSSIVADDEWADPQTVSCHIFQLLTCNKALIDEREWWKVNIISLNESGAIELIECFELSSVSMCVWSILAYYYNTLHNLLLLMCLDYLSSIWECWLISFL